MILEIPFKPSLSEDAFKTTINGVTYKFAVHWNYRENAFFLAVSDSDNQPLVTDIKIVLGAFLGRTVKVAPFTEGIFVVIDTSRTGKEADFDGLGGRVKIRFIPTTDLITRIQGTS